MNNTKYFEGVIESLDPSSDDYEDMLIRIASEFRFFDEAMNEFLIKRGYTGDIADPKEKVSFINQKFEERNVIDKPRNMEKWFLNKAEIERKNAFLICFAFGLNLEETIDFFKRVVQLGKTFDLRNVDEVVYYYCIVNRYDYSKAKTLISDIKNKTDEMVVTLDDIKYTQVLADDIAHINDDDALVKYISSNIENFDENKRHYTAYKTIESLWTEIFDKTSRTGLIFDEKYDIEIKNLNSLWNAYKYILGFDDEMEIKDRAIPRILKDNKYINDRAAKAFPDRLALQQITSAKEGKRLEPKSYDTVRKLIILLFFYRFWAKNKIRTGSYDAKEGDGERFISELNARLLEANFQELYPCNPYDWIFCFFSKKEQPLLDFRYYMSVLFSEYAENMSFE